MFETTRDKTERLERKIERALKKALGYEVRTFVRGEAELVEIAKYRPFRQSQFDETWQSNIILLADNLNEKIEAKCERVADEHRCVRGSRKRDLLAAPQEAQWNAIFYCSARENSRSCIHRPRSEHH